MIRLITKTTMLTMACLFFIANSFAMKNTSSSQSTSTNQNSTPGNASVVELTDANVNFVDPAFIAYAQQSRKNLVFSQLSIAEKVSLWNDYQSYINTKPSTSGTQSGAKGILLFEDFEAGIPASWTNIDNDGIPPNASALQITAWDTIDNFDLPGDAVAVSNSWLASVTPADDWLITPQVMLDGGSTLVWDAKAQDALFPDGYEVRISTTGPTVANFLANPPLFTIAAENPTWTNRTVDLATAGYTNQMVYIAFRNNSTDQFILLLDDVTINDSQGPAAASDASISGASPVGSGIAGGYTNIPTSQAQGNNVSFNVDVASLGTDSISSVTVNGTITPGGAVVSGSLPLINALDTGLVTTNSFAAMPATSYTANFDVCIAEPDVDITNNTLTYAFNTGTVGDSIYARENATTSTGNLGFNGATGRFGNIYTVNTADTVSSITVFLGGNPSGKSFELFIGQLNGAGDIYSTPTISGLTAIGFYTFDVGGVILSPGDYIVGVNQSTTTNIAVGLTTSVFYPNTTYFGGYGAWSAIESIGNPAFNGSFMVRPNFGPVVAASLSPFTLTSPPDGTLLDVTGVGTQTVNITWNASTSTPPSTVTYEWLLDVQGGNFSNPLAVIPTGSATNLTLTYTDIDNVLASAGVAIGDTAFTSWTVRASATAAQIFATAPFDLDLIRSGLGSPMGSRDFEAYNAGDLIVASDLEWEFWPGANIDAPVSIAQAQSGSNSLLVDGAPNQDLVFKLGNQTSGTWGVGFSMFVPTGNGAYYNLQETEIPGVRWPIGNVEFDPGGTGEMTDNTGATLATFTFPSAQWFDVRNYIDLDNDSFQVWINNVFVYADAWTAQPPAAGTAQLQLGGINIYPQGDAANNPALQVFFLDDMYFQPDSLRSNAPVVVAPFNLTSPPSGTRLEVEAGNQTQVVISWDATTSTPVAPVTYRWLLVPQGGNLANPFLSLPSDNGGADPQLTLTLDQIDDAIAGITTDSVDVEWSVEATAGNGNALAANGPFDLKLVRLPVGLSQELFNTKVKFYPNPTNGELVIEVKDNLISSVSIMNMVGQSLEQFEISESTSVLDLSTYSNGMYLIKFTSEEGEYTQKLIIE